MNISSGPENPTLICRACTQQLHANNCIGIFETDCKIVNMFIKCVSIEVEMHIYIISHMLQIYLFFSRSFYMIICQNTCALLAMRS